ncbi:MAG: hypothetical protein ACLFTQ_00785 [Candidatus Aenigmatarchaeota archaeon]
MKRKGQVESPSWLIGPLLIIGLFSISVVFIGIAYSETVAKVETGVSELEIMNMENRLLSSEKCLSTGELGVLDKNRLDEFKENNCDWDPANPCGLSDFEEGDIRWECPATPSITYRVEVEDLETGEEWILGSELTENLEGERLNASFESKRSVAINTSSGVNPGKATLYFRTAREDPLLAVRKHAANAWVTGKSRTIIKKEGDSTYIDFPEEGVMNRGLGENVSHWRLPARIGATGEKIKFVHTGPAVAGGERLYEFKRVEGEIEIDTEEI